MAAFLFELIKIHFIYSGWLRCLRCYRMSVLVFPLAWFLSCTLEEEPEVCRWKWNLADITDSVFID